MGGSEDEVFRGQKVSAMQAKIAIPKLRGVSVAGGSPCQVPQPPGLRTSPIVCKNIDWRRNLSD